MGTKSKVTKPKVIDQSTALAATIARGIKEGFAAESAPDDNEKLINDLVAAPEKQLLLDALEARSNGRVILKRGSATIVDPAKTAKFIAHLHAVGGNYNYPKFMGQRIKRWSDITAQRTIADCFYSAAGMGRIALVIDEDDDGEASGVNPVSGVRFPINDRLMMEKIAFVASHVRVSDPSDPDVVQPIVDMVMGEDEPKALVANALDDYNEAIENDDQVSLSVARSLLSMNSAAAPTLLPNRPTLPNRPQAATAGSVTIGGSVSNSTIVVGGNSNSIVTSESVFDRMVRLLPAQFDELVFKMKVPPGFVSPNTVPMGSRAIELIRWCEASRIALSDVNDLLNSMSR